MVNSASINNGYGIRSIGSNITVRVEGSKIIGNGLGLSGGGAVITGGGNTIQTTPRMAASPDPIRFSELALTPALRARIGPCRNTHHHLLFAAGGARGSSIY